MAFGAHHFLAVGTLAAAIAFGAGSQPVVDDFLFRARCNLFERKTQPHAHIAALAAYLRTAGTCPATEEAGEQVAHAEAPTEDVAEIDIGGTGAGSAGDGAESVVLCTLIRIAQHVIGLIELFELVFGVFDLIHIGMELTRLAAESLLDFLISCVLVDAQNLVKIISH